MRALSTVLGLNESNFSPSPPFVAAAASFDFVSTDDEARLKINRPATLAPIEADWNETDNTKHRASSVARTNNGIAD